MKATLAALALLSLAGPAFAQDWSRQDWPRQDWYVFSAPVSLGEASPSTLRSGLIDAPPLGMSGPEARPVGVPPAGRVNVAMNIDSINRVGDQVEVRYFVWSDRSGYAEVTSRINCARTGEQVVLSKDYDRGFAPVRTSVESQKRVTPTSMAVATRACHPSQRGRISDKSLPEVVEGAS